MIDYSQMDRLQCHATSFSFGKQVIAEMEPGLRVTGHRVSDFGPGRVESRVSVSYPVFDPVLSFNMRVYCMALLTPSLYKLVLKLYVKLE